MAREIVDKMIVFNESHWRGRRKRRRSTNLDVKETDEVGAFGVVLDKAHNSSVLETPVGG